MSWSVSGSVRLQARCCRVGPGNFHPSPSQIPDVILSHHPARAIARRLPPFTKIAGSSRFDPVGPRSTTITHPLRSKGCPYYEAVAPLWRIGTFSPTLGAARSFSRFGARLRHVG